MMLGYQWPFWGRKLVQTLNYANLFTFMLYGWDAGKELTTVEKFAHG